MKKIVVGTWIVVLSFALILSLSSAGLSYAADSITLTFAHHLPPTTLQHQAAEKFAELVKEKSDGQVIVNLAPSGQLGGQREVIEAVKLGSIEMGYGESGMFSGYITEFGVLALPFLFRDLDHYHAMADGEIGKALADKLQQKTGLQILNWVDGGIRDTYLVKGPVNSVADFNGIKIRTPESRVFVATFRALGANPTPVPAPEMYSALQSGVVDAMEGTAETGWAFKIYEVAKHCSETRHINTDLSMTINSDYLKGLPQDIQQILIEAAQESAVWQRNAWAENVGTFKKQLMDEGVTFNQVNLDEFREAVKPLYKDFLKDMPEAQELVEKIRSL